MNVIEQRASIAVVLSLGVLALGMAVRDEGEDARGEPDLIADPSLFVRNTATEPITLLEVRLAGASVLGPPRVVFPGDRLTLSVVRAPEGVRPPWRVRWLHDGRVRHTSWSRGWSWLEIAGPHATAPDRRSCVMGGGTEVVVAWDAARAPRREITRESSDFVPVELPDFK